MHESRRSNEALLSSLSAALKQESVLVADVITMLMEVEDRRLHLQLACSSMFDFCTRRLGMSEGQTFRRLAAARLARTFPAILEAVRSRRLHLSSIALLRELFTAENVDELIAAASGKSKSYVKDLVARLAPKPDVPSRIRQLPSPAALASHAELPAAAPASIALSPPPVRTSSDVDREVGSERSGPAATVAPLARRIAVSEQFVPLSESRHKVQFTASTELRRKLERAQDLMRHRNIDGDLAIVIERALDLLVAKLEKEKFAKTSQPKGNGDKSQPLPSEGALDANVDQQSHVSNEKREPSADARRDDFKPPRGVTATRREVAARDGEQCTFTSPEGERCPSRALIEIDHRHPRALGGGHTSANLRLLCRAHNHFQAEHVFGKEHVANAIDQQRRKSAVRKQFPPSPPKPPSSDSAASSPKQPSLPFD